MQWLRRAMIGSMGTGYNAIMIGNLFHPKSVIANFIAEKDSDGTPLYVSRVYDCWIDYGKPTQRPLWPALWSAERLVKKQRGMGTIDFNAEMRNMVSNENARIKGEWITYYDPEEIEGCELVVASFVDPSPKSGEENDYKAVITVALNKEAMICYCLHAWIRHDSIGAMFDAAYDQHDNYGKQPVGIEENMLKDFLHESIQTHAKRKGRYLPWRPKHHSTNKIGRIIGTLAYLVEFGKLKFRKGHSDQDLLVEQLIYLDNATVHDDGPDALEGAVSMVQGSGRAAYGGIDPESRKRISEQQKALRPEVENGQQNRSGLFQRGRGFARMLKRRLREAA